LSHEAAPGRFPRELVRHQPSERLLERLGVEIVDEWDGELADAARTWLADMERQPGGDFPESAIAAVRRALARYDARRSPRPRREPPPARFGQR
jgi:hypothetical protein